MHMGRGDVERVGRVVKQFGFGRLPGADHHNVGAGYACASAAFLATSAFVLLTLAVSAIAGTGEGSSLGLGILALAAYPLVVPAAFGLGWLTWRVLPIESPPAGAVAGFLVALLVYPVATVGVIVSMLRPQSYTAGMPLEEQLVGAVGSSVLFGVVAFFLTFWLTLPLGAAGGYVYEAVRAESE